nr:arginase family [uncultured bacterium]
MTPSGSSTASGDVHLRLIWPQWQGAGTSSIEAFASEFSLDVARRGYALGTSVLEAVLPPHDGPVAYVPVSMSNDGLQKLNGIEARMVVVKQLADALAAIGRHDPARITTLGGDCSVSVAPFSALANRYGDELAVIWVDSHPDVGTPESDYAGFHAMAVAALVGHGDPEVHDLLPATISPARVALAGVHSWDDDDFSNVQEWGIRAFSPDDLRATSKPLLDWIASTGCSRVAIHFDVDVIDSNDILLGLGPEPDGLTRNQVQRIVNDIDAVADVVGLTIAEFILRQVVHLQQILSRFPLLSDASDD